jgi:DNA helicase-2/ATP-dependent DNA helicase PcrA
MTKKHSLNQNQKEAIEYISGPLLIVAGAGTGKTTVITEKIAYLIKNNLAKPEEILALTFTEKAAEEMEDRVSNLLDIGYTEMQISTFHAFCQRILENYALDIGLPNQFKRLNQIDAWLLIRENLNKFNLDYYQPLGNPTRHIHELIKHFSKCKDELITPQEYLDYAENVKLNADEVNKEEKNRLTEIANAYQVYNQVLLDNNSLDFGDLIFYTVKLLQKRKNILKFLQKQFKYILVDEFQDVNHAQYELVKLLFNKEFNQLTVVGDDDQSIYAFRGASVSNILRFKDDFVNSKEIVLTENYRSGQEILDLAYQSIQNNNPDRLEVKLNLNKRLISNKKGSKIEHLQGLTLEEEAEKVAEKILEIKKNEVASWDDFLILARANSHVEPFIAEFEKRGIPFEFLASSGLFHQPIVMDAINFLKVIDQYRESSSLYRLLLLPFFNILLRKNQFHILMF